MTDFQQNIDSLLSDLGITRTIRQELSLPLQPEAIDLVQCENDIFDRPQYMARITRQQWQAMRSQASADGIELELVSAFRSVEYQCNLIRAKLDKGQALEDILKVNAVPGYSEHHTGRALDLNTPNCEPLSEAFEQTPAFDWLCRNAHRFSFTLTYPRDNPLGIAYEPWHWACQG
ncbi:MAG: M15 family metallopeptidase [Pseudomonadales bacterium]